MLIEGHFNFIFSNQHGNFLDLGNECGCFFFVGQILNKTIESANTRTIIEDYIMPSGKKKTIMPSGHFASLNIQRRTVAGPNHPNLEFEGICCG